MVRAPIGVERLSSLQIWEPAWSQRRNSGIAHSQSLVKQGAEPFRELHIGREPPPCLWEPHVPLPELQRIQIVLSLNLFGVGRCPRYLCRVSGPTQRVQTPWWSFAVAPKFGDLQPASAASESADLLDLWMWLFPRPACPWSHWCPWSPTLPLISFGEQDPGSEQSEEEKSQSELSIN